MMSNLTDLSEQLTAAILQGDGTTALDLFADYAERADTMMVTLARDLRHMTEERDAISSAWDELAAERDALRAQLDAAGWQPVTDDWPPVSNSLPVLMRNGLTRYGYRSGGHWHLTGGKYTADAVTHAFQLPPAPPQE